MSIVIRDLVKSFNLGQTMDDEQVADLVNDLIDQYYWLNLEDFRLCFNNAKSGRYDKGIFRLDASVVLSWVSKYASDRLSAADESSYSESQSHRGESNSTAFETYHDKFRKRRL